MDLPISKPLLLCMAVILGTGSNIITLRAQSQSLYKKPTQSALVNQQKNREFNQDSYILGPGDVLEIELFDLPGLTGLYAIGPDGTIYMPRLRAVHVEGLTIEEVRSQNKLCEGTICYTNDVTDPNEKKYTLKYYLDLVKDLEKAGANIIAIKDMAGLAKPNAI